MPKKEIEGDFVLGWPDRKRPLAEYQKDAEDRVLYARSPVLDLQGLITPTDGTYVVTHLQVPEPVHPDDYRLAIGGEVENPMELGLDDLQKFPGRTVRAVTE